MTRILLRKPVQDTFEVHKTSLQSILTDIDDGRVQLPNMQRSWRWPDGNVVKVLESIAVGHPVGAIMQIETGGDVKFQHRGFEGTPADIAERVVPSHLILDGQQRCTSLYQACFTKKPVKVESESKARHHLYFFDMTKVLYEDVPMSDAIISLLVDWRGVPIRRSGPDLTDEKVQFEGMFFPVNHMFDFADWDQRYHAFWDAEDIDRKLASDARQTARDFHSVIVRAFTQCMVPVIMLRRGMTVKGVCKVYENLNSLGVPLDAFDLLIAHFAAEGYCLRTDWYGPRGKAKSGTKAGLVESSNGIIEDIDPKQFMQAVILANGLDENRSVGIEKDDILSLGLQAYLANRDAVIGGFSNAFAFLREEMVFSSRTAPTALFITALAALFAKLGEDGSRPEVRTKLRRWLWTLAVSASNLGNSTRELAAEIPSVMGWLVNDAPEPNSIVNPIVTYGDIREARKGGNIHKAIVVAMLRGDARDPASGLVLTPEHLGGKEAEDVPLFPSAWCKENAVDAEIADSILNRILVAPTRRGQIGRTEPSKAFQDIVGKGQPPFLIDHALSTQGIDANAFKADDFTAFAESRLRSFAQIVEQLIGQRVISDDDLIALQARAPAEDTDGIEYVPEHCLWKCVGRGGTVFLGVKDGSFVALAGSIMSGDAQPSLDERFALERDRMISEGLVRQEGEEEWLLLNDYPANSPSHAYSLFVGQKAVGRIWRDMDGAICNPALPEAVNGEQVAASVESTTEKQPYTDEIDHEIGIWGIVETVESAINDELGPVGKNRFVSGDGKSVRFAKTSVVRGAETLVIGPDHFDADSLVVWTPSGDGWMIPVGKLRDFLECIPSIKGTWEARMGFGDGEDRLQVGTSDDAALNIKPYYLLD